MPGDTNDQTQSPATPEQAAESEAAALQLDYEATARKLNDLAEKSKDYTAQELKVLDPEVQDELQAIQQGKNPEELKNQVAYVEWALEKQREALKERTEQKDYLVQRYANLRISPEDWTAALAYTAANGLATEWDISSRGTKGNATKFQENYDDLKVLLQDVLSVAETGSPDEWEEMKRTAEFGVEMVHSYAKHQADEKAGEDVAKVDSFEEFQAAIEPWKGLSPEDWQWAVKSAREKEDLDGMFEGYYGLVRALDGINSLEDLSKRLESTSSLSWKIDTAFPTPQWKGMEPEELAEAAIRLLYQFFPNGYKGEKTDLGLAKPENKEKSAETVERDMSDVVESNLRFFALEYGMPIPNDQKFFDHLVLEAKRLKETVLAPIYDPALETFKGDSVAFEKALEKEFLAFSNAEDLKEHALFLERFDQLLEKANLEATDPTIQSFRPDSEGPEYIEAPDFMGARLDQMLGDPIYNEVSTADADAIGSDNARELVRAFLDEYAKLPETVSRDYYSALLPVEGREEASGSIGHVIREGEGAASPESATATVPESSEALREEHKAFLEGLKKIDPEANYSPDFAVWVKENEPDFYKRIQELGDLSDEEKASLLEQLQNVKNDYETEQHRSPTESTPPSYTMSEGEERTPDVPGEDPEAVHEAVLQNPRDFAEITENPDGSLTIRLKDSLTDSQEQCIRLLWILEACKQGENPADWKAIKGGVHYENFYEGKGFYDENWQYCELWKGDEIALERKTDAGGGSYDAPAEETGTPENTSSEVTGTETPPEGYMGVPGELAEGGTSVPVAEAGADVHVGVDMDMDVDVRVEAEPPAELFEDVEGFLTNVAAEVKGRPGKGRPDILEKDHLEDRYRKRFHRRLWKLLGEKSWNSVENLHVSRLAVDEKGTATLVLEYTQRPSGLTKRVEVSVAREKLFSDEPKERVPNRLTRVNGKREDLHVDGSKWGVQVDLNEENSRLNRRALRRLLRKLGCLGDEDQEEE